MSAHNYVSAINQATNHDCAVKSTRIPRLENNNSATNSIRSECFSMYPILRSLFSKTALIKTLDQIICEEV